MLAEVGDYAPGVRQLFRNHQLHHDTVGAVAVDLQGRVAASGVLRR